jgi:hypothetical protein
VIRVESPKDGLQPSCQILFYGRWKLPTVRNEAAYLTRELKSFISQALRVFNYKGKKVVYDMFLWFSKRFVSLVGQKYSQKEMSNIAIK